MNLPLVLTSFVGRVPEIDAVKALISEARLVTVTGAGGIGKTRLALEVARQSADAHAGGVWLVELAALTNPALVPQIALRSLGLRPQPGRTPVESLIGMLGHADETLLVVDNCEHIVEACAQLADTLLRSCPNLRLLATSREVLGVDGEITWRVPSMTTPDLQHAATPEDLQTFESVQLFAQRAGAARPGFHLDQGNASRVARICQRLDGIPLAIELAAARTRSMSVTAIDEHLDDCFHLLTGGSRMSLPRQRTLQATLDWSHDLLDGDEKRLFRRLSVFRGGFTLEAAEAVCEESEGDSAGAVVLDNLSSLVDRSLVIADERPDQSERYRLLETIRHYGSDRLSEAGEREPVERRHAHFHLAFADEASRELRGPRQSHWIARVEDEFDNLRACREWAMRHEPTSALRLAVALHAYWRDRNSTEGGDWVTQALEATSERDELRAAGLREASWWATLQNHVDDGRRYAGECLILAKDLGSSLHTGKALHALGLAECFDESEGHLARGIALFEQAERLLRAANDEETLAFMLNDCGLMMHFAGDSAVGQPKVEEAVALARRFGDQSRLAAFVESLATIEFETGDVAGARAHWQECLALSGEIRSVFTAPEALEGLARIALIESQPERCLRLLAAADELRTRAGLVPQPDAKQGVADTQDAARRLLDADAAETAWREGAGMSLTAAVRYGLGEPLQPEPVATPGEPTPATAEAPSQNMFVQEGEFWTLGFAGRVVRLKNRKGLQDIARLLATPGTETAAIDLAHPPMAEVPGREPMVAEAGLGIEGGAGPVLDAEARRQYRARLLELEDEVVEAEAANDLERASRAREEREFLVAELGAAVGLGGRDRRQLDPVERARKAVTWRVRDAINRIDSAHPDLGRHLRHSVRTGTFCAYDPPEITAWETQPPRSTGR
jgi:non-specific serine/threonine protein kinase